MTCRYCGETCLTLSELLQHYRDVHPELYYKSCQYCGRSVMMANIDSHERACIENPNRVISQSEKSRLQKLQDESQPGSCRFCQKFCKNQNSLRNHERTCRNNPDRYGLPKHTGKGGWPKGKPTWSKGLTAETDARVAKMTEATRKGHAIARAAHPEKFTGRGCTEEAELLRRQKISESIKRSRNCGGLRTRSGVGHKGRIRGVYCDSTYELVYVLFNLDNNIQFSRCKRSYPYTYNGKSHLYHPDFELSDGSLVEIKGYYTPVVDAKIASVTDRPITVLYEKDLKYAFDWVMNNYTFSHLWELYDK